MFEYVRELSIKAEAAQWFADERIGLPKERGRLQADAIENNAGNRNKTLALQQAK